MEFPSADRVLIAPLNWGLGHAARCIPIIRHYLSSGSDLILASDGEALGLLLKEFPGVRSIEIPGYDVSYPERGKNMAWNMAIQVPKILRAVKKENDWTRSFCAEQSLDLIISDHRYGVRNEKVKSIFLAHQLNILTPIGSGLINVKHKELINCFDECWIPDNEGLESLAGELIEQALDIPKCFIGPLSRLLKMDVEKDISVIVILSGIEPQRTLLEELVLPILRNKERAVLIRGKMDDRSDSNDGACRVIGHADSSLTGELMNRSHRVICRSGYSSIMDLIALEKRGILIPTPGQTEQEYLAERLGNREQFDVILQSEVQAELKSLLS